MTTAYQMYFSSASYFSTWTEKTAKRRTISEMSRHHPDRQTQSASIIYVRKSASYKCYIMKSGTCEIKK